MSLPFPTHPCILALRSVSHVGGHVPHSVAFLVIWNKSDEQQSDCFGLTVYVGEGWKRKIRKSPGHGDWHLPLKVTLDDDSDGGDGGGYGGDVRGGTFTEHLLYTRHRVKHFIWLISFIPSNTLGQISTNVTCIEWVRKPRPRRVDGLHLRPYG